MEIIVTALSKADQSFRTIRQPVNGRLVLGRGPDSAVPLEAPGISREHLEVQAEDRNLFLIDLSSNGTWLNGARMPPRRKCRVAETDLVELPGYELRFQMASAAAANHPATVPAPHGPVSATVPVPPAPGESRSKSVLSSFTSLEIFLFLIAAASLALLVLYLAY